MLKCCLMQTPLTESVKLQLVIERADKAPQSMPPPSCVAAALTHLMLEQGLPVTKPSRERVARGERFAM